MTKKDLILTISTILVTLGLVITSFYIGYFFRQSQIPKPSNTIAEITETNQTEDNSEFNLETVKSTLPPGYVLYSEEELNAVAHDVIEQHLQNTDEPLTAQEYVDID
jgi:hypothetical protein